MTNRRLKSHAMATLAAAGLLTITGNAAADPESRAAWVYDYDRWGDDGDAGGVSIGDGLWADDYHQVEAEFHALGEWLHIWDQYPNGRDTVARLWVGGSGPAVYYGDGYDTVRSVNLSYDEGQTVYLQVCTSDSPNARCTDKEKYAGTS